MHGPFDDVAAAQKAVNEFRYDYNHERPHQGIDADVPAVRFTAVPAEERRILSLDIPPELRPHLIPTPGPAPQPPPGVAEVLAPGELTRTGHWLGGSALQCERVVIPTGKITVGRHQIRVGFAHVGRTSGVWADTPAIHLAYDRVGNCQRPAVRVGSP